MRAASARGNTLAASAPSGPQVSPGAMADGLAGNTSPPGSAAPPVVENAVPVLAAAGQTVDIGSAVSVPAGVTPPAFLDVAVLDRNEYTAGFQTSALGYALADGVKLNLAPAGGDALSTGITYSWNAATRQYVNASYGALSQLQFVTGSQAGDTVSVDVYTSAIPSLAVQYANNPAVLSANPALFTTVGNATILTQASGTGVATAATPGSMVSAALSYVGEAWNAAGCWVLVTDIAAMAGSSLPISSSYVATAAPNGEWFVAFDGPALGAAATDAFVDSLVPGETVTFLDTGGYGHATTVVSGSGASAMLVDNASDGSNGAGDGDPNDVTILPPHPEAEEFGGVTASSVVVYELDCPVVTAVAATMGLVQGQSADLASELAASDPAAGQSVTQYQLYQTNGAELLAQGGQSLGQATSSATAVTVASLAGVSLVGLAAGTDTVDVRASNGRFWGDWTSFNVAVAPPVADNPAAGVFGGMANQYRYGETADGTLDLVDANPLGSRPSDGSVAITQGALLTFSDGMAIADPDGNIGAVARLYQAAFGHQAGADPSGWIQGVLFWNHTLDLGYSTLTVAQDFVSSAEFQADYGGASNQQFVADLYGNVLGRVGSQSEVNAWAGSLDDGGNSRASVLLAFAEGGENELNTLAISGSPDHAAADRMYQAALGRSVDPAASNAIAALVDQGTPELPLIQGLMASAEYASGLGSLANQAFVDQLSANAYGGIPASYTAGDGNWTAALQSGALGRAQVVQSFADSLGSRLETSPATHDGLVMVRTS